MEQLIKQLDKIEARQIHFQEEALDKLEAIRVEAVRTNGRVYANEKEINKLWKVTIFGGGLIALVVLALVARGILTVEQLPIP